MLQCVLYYSGFVDIATPYIEASLQRRSRANPPAVRYWLRPVTYDGIDAKTIRRVLCARISGAEFARHHFPVNLNLIFYMDGDY